MNKIDQWKTNRLIECGIYRLQELGFEDEASAILSEMCRLSLVAGEEEWQEYVRKRAEMAAEVAGALSS